MTSSNHTQLRLQSITNQISKMSQTNNPDFQLSEVFNVKGKIALVTGGGSGIGLMVSIARHGCDGLPTDLN